MGSDAELLAVMANGEGAAIGELFDRHRDRVFRHSLRLVGSAADAEEVVAIVFLILWRKRRHVRLVENSAIPWLLATANNTARNLNRSRRRYALMLARLPPAEPVPDHAPAVLDKLAGSDREHAIRRAFNTLSRRDQEVLSLCVLEELSTAVTAAALGVPLGTVKSRLSRAKTRLAEVLGADPTFPTNARSRS